ncbi:MAG: hypothetical protein AB7J40_05955, partial [Candidatus Altimarinota bacterium]
LSIIHQILKNVTCTRMELVTLFMDHQFFKEAYPRLPNKAPNMAEFEKGLNEKPYVVDQIHIGEQGVFSFSGKKYVILNQRPSRLKKVHGQFKVRLLQDGGKGKGGCVSTLCATLQEVEKLEQERGITIQKGPPQKPTPEHQTNISELVIVRELNQQWINKTRERSDLRRIVQWLIEYCCPKDQRKKKRLVNQAGKPSARDTFQKSVMIERLLSLFPSLKDDISINTSEGEIISRVNRLLIDDSKNGGQLIRYLAGKFHIKLADPSNIMESIPYHHNPAPFREGASSFEQGEWLRWK